MPQCIRVTTNHFAAVVYTTEDRKTEKGKNRSRKQGDKQRCHQADEESLLFVTCATDLHCGQSMSLLLSNVSVVDNLLCYVTTVMGEMSQLWTICYPLSKIIFQVSSCLSCGPSTMLHCSCRQTVMLWCTLCVTVVDNCLCHSCLCTKGRLRTICILCC